MQQIGKVIQIIIFPAITFGFLLHVALFRKGGSSMVEAGNEQKRHVVLSDRLVICTAVDISGTCKTTECLFQNVAGNSESSCYRNDARQMSAVLTSGRR